MRTKVQQPHRCLEILYPGLQRRRRCKIVLVDSLLDRCLDLLQLIARATLFCRNDAYLPAPCRSDPGRTGSCGGWRSLGFGLCLGRGKLIPER